VDPLELYRELEQKRRDLDVCIKELRKNGTALAEAERAYKIELRATVLYLKEQGMPATLINLTVYGEENVADLRYEREVAEATYKANLEAIQSIKLQLRLISEQVTRELGGPNVGTGM
jgi:hypothetical protein